MTQIQENKTCSLCGVVSAQVIQQTIVVDQWKGALAKKAFCPPCWAPAILLKFKISCLVLFLILIAALVSWAIDSSNIFKFLLAFFVFLATLICSFNTYLLNPSYRLHAVGRIDTFKARAILFGTSILILGLVIIAGMILPGIRSPQGYETVTYRLGHEVSRRAASSLDMIREWQWIVIGLMIFGFIFSMMYLFSAFAVVPTNLLDAVSRKYKNK